jgi:hypothetical protein
MSTDNRTISYGRVVMENLEARQLYSLATEASDVYLYGLTLVLADISEQIPTTVSSPSSHG